MSENHSTKIIAEKEIWKEVYGWEGLYKVSNLGRIKALPCSFWQMCRWGFKVKRTRKEKIIKPSNAGHYMLVWLHGPNRRKNRSLHSIVLEAFVCPRPKGLTGCHNDGDYTNNRLDNLRWDTHKGNHQDRIRHGTNNYGENNGECVLTEKQVMEMRKMYATGAYYISEIAKKFGVHDVHAGDVVKGRLWKHLPVLKCDFGRGHVRKRQIEQRKRELGLL